MSLVEIIVKFHTGKWHSVQREVCRQCSGHAIPLHKDLKGIVLEYLTLKGYCDVCLLKRCLYGRDLYAALKLHSRLGNRNFYYNGRTVRVKYGSGLGFKMPWKPIVQIRGSEKPQVEQGDPLVPASLWAFHDHWVFSHDKCDFIMP